jgi:hypothetical protein
MWSVRQVGGPNTRGSAVVRMPHSPIAKLEIDSSGTPVHSMIVWVDTLNWDV